MGFVPKKCGYRTLLAGCRYRTDRRFSIQTDTEERTVPGLRNGRQVRGNTTAGELKTGKPATGPDYFPSEMNPDYETKPSGTIAA